MSTPTAALALARHELAQISRHADLDPEAKACLALAIDALTDARSAQALAEQGGGGLPHDDTPLPLFSGGWA